MSIDHHPGQIEGFSAAEMAPQSADPAMLRASKYPRRKGDYYATEPWVTECLMRHFEPCNAARTVWEPACGEGHMARVIKAAGHFVYATDLFDRGYGHERALDFLEQKFAPTGVRSIITNPPYSHAHAFVVHALDLMSGVNGTVAMLLRNEWSCAQGRQHLFTAENGFELKLTLTRRPRWIEGSTGSPRHSYSWYCWDFSKLRGAQRIIHDQ